MQFGLRQARNGAEEMKNANYPDIRYYVVGERVSYSPVSVSRGSWRGVSPTTLGGGPGGISAAADFFARKVREAGHVPIGLLQEAWGGGGAVCGRRRISSPGRCGSPYMCPSACSRRRWAAFRPRRSPA